MLAVQQRLDRTAPKVEDMKLARTGSTSARKRQVLPSKSDGGDRRYTNSTGTIPDDLLYQPDTGVVDFTTIQGSSRDDSVRDGEQYDDREGDEPHYYARELVDEPIAGARNDSPGREFLEEDLYKLRLKTGLGAPVGIHETWEVVRESGDFEYEGEAQAAVTDSGSESGMPEIPDAAVRQPSPPLPPIPQSEAGGDVVHMPESHWSHQGYGSDVRQQTPPWQLIHQRLLNWTNTWHMSELDAALGSTIRGQQVDEISLSIWATQNYKRYVRSRLTDSPQGRVDRLFVPPNVAAAIDMGVRNGRHWDVHRILRGLWTPFGLDGIPRLLIVLSTHRRDANHWVVHRCVYISFASARSNF